MLTIYVYWGTAFRDSVHKFMFRVLGLQGVTKCPDPSVVWLGTKSAFVVVLVVLDRPTAGNARFRHAGSAAILAGWPVRKRRHFARSTGLGASLVRSTGLTGNVAIFPVWADRKRRHFVWFVRPETSPFCSIWQTGNPAPFSLVCGWGDQENISEFGQGAP